jgi:hypothetical protein
MIESLQMADGRYACANCGKPSSMLGHLDGLGNFSCQRNPAFPSISNPAYQPAWRAITLTPGCFLDWDGVIVAFMKAALAAHKSDFGIANVTKWHIYEHLGITSDQFWHDLQEEFWMGMDWDDQGIQLLEGLEGIFGDRIAMLTAPPNGRRGADEGKRAWIRKNRPEYVERTFIGPAKQHMASINKILIDDSDRNINAFEAWGGHGVLIPRPWNTARGEVINGHQYDLDRILTRVREKVRLIERIQCTIPTM